MKRRQRGPSHQHEKMLARRRSGPHSSQLELSYHKGPLPTADEIAKYDAIYPGAAKIIFDTFQSQVSHRQRLEASVIEANARAQRIAPVLGAALAGLIIVGGFLVVLLRGDAWGYGAILGSGATLVGVAVWARREQAKERREKEDALARRTED